jgi:MHS family proline/betaine transporter-like MFS transporter
MIIKNKQSISFAILGHIYEHYENTLFSFIAPFVASIFFSPSGTKMSRIGIYVAVAAGFLMRPFGAIFFSWIGDKYGRKKALIYSVTFCVIPSTLIGLLPSYAMIGKWSSAVLILSRLLQGISIGGGFYATLTFVSESGNASKKNLFLGITLSMGFLGAILGTLSSSYFMSKSFGTWGWRIPFLIGGVYGICLFLLRNLVKESREWETSEHSNHSIPFIEAVKLYPRNIIAILLFGMGLLIPFYLVVSWLPGHIIDTFHLSTSHNLVVSSLLMLTSGIAMIVFSWLTTWIKLKTMIVGSCIMGVISFFLLFKAINTQSYSLILFTQFFVAILTSLQSAPAIILIQKLFPTKYKFSGFAVPFSIGQATLIGSTPLLCEIISTHTNNPANVCYLLLLTVILVLTATLLAHPTKEMGDSAKRILD